MRYWSRKGCGQLFNLDDVRRGLGLVAERDAGLRAIEVDQVIGTVDRCFNALKEHLRKRVLEVRKAFPEGDFPPIHVVQVDRGYFVIDGHKRLAAARMLRVLSIDAHVTRLASPYPLDKWTRPSDFALLEAHHRFLRSSGLEESQPFARFLCRTVNQYHELLEAVQAYGYNLARPTGRPPSTAEVAAAWYNNDYLPVLRSARSETSATCLTRCPEGELYLVARRLTRGEHPGDRVAPKPGLHFPRPRWR